MKKSLTLLLLGLPFCGFAQTSITGKVVTEEKNVAIADVIVTNTLTNEWTMTDKLGEFSFENITSSFVNLSFSILGKQEKKITLQLNEFKNYQTVTLANQDLRLDEIVINVQKSDQFSEINFGREQIDQVQALSLNDVLELLPGQSISNFSMNEFKPIVFRTAKPASVSDNSFGNKSFGTQVVLDGIPMSNNENMQSYGSNNGGTFSPNTLGFSDRSSGSYTNANYGTDLRAIATENIQNIEVVQGIPSVKYGDLTSGLIKIEQRAGKAPFQLSASLREGTQQYTATKGFDLKKSGTLNATVDYLNSNPDPRNTFSVYKRINSQIMWSTSNVSKTLRNAFTIDYGFNNDDANYEPQNTDLKVTRNKRTDFGISNRLKWKADYKLFNNLNFNVNYKVTNQLSYDSKVVNVGGEVIATSLEEGIYLGSYTAPSYRYIKEVDGKPINIFAALEFSKNITTSTFNHNIGYGFHYKLSDNKGKGRLGAPETQVNQYGLASGNGGIGFRPYSYLHNVRAESIFSAYIEDVMVRDFENSRLNVSGGLRYDNFYGINVVQPRFNTFYEIPGMKFRAGYGLTAKAPSLNQIYTGSRYYDVVLGDYRLPGVYNVAFVQTFIDTPNNLNLKPSKSQRFELGYDVMLPFATFNLTGYYNKLYDGITDDYSIIKRDLANIEVVNNGSTKPDYSIVGHTDYYYLQRQITNKQESKDKGLEFFVSLKENLIKNVSIDLNGAYIETTNFDNVDDYQKSNDATKNEIYGLYKPFKRRYSNFKLGGNISYHNPTLGLIVSMRSEHFIIDDISYTQDNLPYAYINKSFEKHLIAEADRGNTTKYGHIQNGGGINEDSKLNEMYHNFHLRISKDFLSGFRFSFYVNNFLNLRPARTKINSNGTASTFVNPDVIQLSFGTKIEFKF